tara:strand:- start:6950 stop:7594 length:645 start_codon:yes stop_codon:yes gene_type:complete
MSKHPRYDLKKAYDKHLTGKARLHYLENYEHDVHTRGGAGHYSGNHPRYSMSMMGDPETPVKKMDDDLKYMPVEDIAGQGTEGINMKTNPIMLKDKRPNPRNLDPNEYHPKADLTDQYPRRKEEDPRSKTYQQKLKKQGLKVDPNSAVTTMKKNPIDMKKTPVKMKKSPAKMGHKSPAKMGHKSPAKMGHKSPAKMGHKSPAKMKGKVTFGRKS